MSTAMLTLETQAKIVRDLAASLPTTGYTPEMVVYRDEVAAEFDAFQAAHPDVKMALWIPCEA